MDRMTEHSNYDIIRHLIEKYGIVDEGGIVDLTDLESREEILRDGDDITDKS